MKKTYIFKHSKIEGVNMSIEALNESHAYRILIMLVDTPNDFELK